jgi:hypothetical protein
MTALPLMLRTPVEILWFLFGGGSGAVLFGSPSLLVGQV